MAVSLSTHAKGISHERQPIRSDDFDVIDMGTAPDILVDGLAHFSTSNGIVRAVDDTHQPLLNSLTDENVVSRYSKIVTVRHLYSLEAHRLMQIQQRSLGNTCKRCGLFPIFDWPDLRPKRALRPMPRRLARRGFCL